MLDSTWRDVPTRARLSEMQIAASGAVYDVVSACRYPQARLN